MDNRRKNRSFTAGFAPIFIVIIVAAVLVLGGGALYFRQIANRKGQIVSQTPVSTTPPTITTSTTTADVSGWKTYRNEKYGFELQYPAPWKVTEGVPQHDPIVAFDGVRTQLFILDGDIARNQTLSDRLAELDKRDQTSYEGQPSIIVNNAKNITVGGEQAIQREETASAAGFDYLDTYVKNGTRLYDFELQPTGGDASVATYDIDIYNQILSTFKFTK